MPTGSGQTIKRFRDLYVWQAGMDLVEQIYRLTRQFPKSETYGLSSQVQRAIVSVPSNIAEGHSRSHIREYLHHLSIARASLAEAATQVEIAGRLEYAPAADIQRTLDQMATLGRQLTALRERLKPLLDGATS